MRRWQLGRRMVRVGDALEGAAACQGKLDAGQGEGGRGFIDVGNKGGLGGQGRGTGVGGGITSIVGARSSVGVAGLRQPISLPLIVPSLSPDPFDGFSLLQLSRILSCHCLVHHGLRLTAVLTISSAFDFHDLQWWRSVRKKLATMEERRDLRNGNRSFESDWSYDRGCSVHMESNRLRSVRVVHISSCDYNGCSLIVRVCSRGIVSGRLTSATVSDLAVPKPSSSLRPELVHVEDICHGSEESSPAA
uniref:Uncharacterized protein n=1 Tax=Ficus carica TaxID=3494 RepID=A0AA88JAB2_FICCA|nr:hypothetical protein TIFTF001_036063 [Ficus carica]GMN67009.1 hypothetical protein TIFTF001_036074 [Ficus carica]